MKNIRQKKIKISLFGNFGTQNIGNECSLQAILYNIREFIPEADVNCICTCPEDVMKRHNINAFSMIYHFDKIYSFYLLNHRVNPIYRALRFIFFRVPIEIFGFIRAVFILKGRDMLIMPGTGMITDSGEALFGFVFEIFKWTIAAKLSRLKILFVSVGVEQNKYNLSKWFIKIALHLADYCCFRDKKSKLRIEKIRHNTKNIKIYPDLAFSLPKTLLPPYRKGFPQKPTIGVGLFDYCDRGIGMEDAKNPYHNYIDKLSKFVAWLVENKYPVRVLIGDVKYDNPVRKDLKNSLEDLLINYKDCHIIDEPIFFVSDLLNQIATTDIVVSTRFHNVLFAIILNKPVISISYDFKNDALMANTGLSDYCQSIDRLDVNKLIKQFLQLEKNVNRLKLQMERKTEEYRKALNEQYSALFNPEGYYGSQF